MNRKTSEEREAELTGAIMTFLADQPQAVTLEKIIEWWIARRPVHVDINAVARAVNQLTEQGLLKGDGEGQSRRYRLKSTANGQE
jgi:Fe2+ or Zn2+ uptake regulation protein